MRISALGIVLGSFFAAAVGRSEELSRYQQTQVHMGMSFGIVLYAPNETAANRALEAAFSRIAALDRMFSDYDPESELNRLCDQAPTPQPVKVSHELAEILDYACQFSERTEGAFDVTIGPLTKLWRRSRRTYQAPDPKRLQEALAAVGYRHLEVDLANETVSLGRPKMRIDLGGIAPGYAADEALKEIAKCGMNRALVNASGDITVADPPPGESRWKIDIGPLEPGGRPSRSVWIRNAAVSTSGDVFQFVEIGGKRYSHIVDPQTGYGLTTRSSVTVVAKDGRQADALATAVSVLGPEKGLQLVEATPGAAAVILTVEDDVKRSYSSKRMPEFSEPVSADIP